MLEIQKYRPEEDRTLPTLAGDCSFSSVFGKFQAPEPFWFLKKPILKHQVEFVLRRTTPLRGVAAIASLYDRNGPAEHFVVNNFNEVVQFRPGLEPRLASCERHLRDMLLLLVSVKERHDRWVNESIATDGKGIRLASSFGWCYWNPYDQWGGEIAATTTTGFSFLFSDACYN